MVEHLLLRGEDPAAVRIADLLPPRRELALKNKVKYCKTDIRDRSSVDSVFATPWPAQVAKLPLTVLDTVALIHAGHRSPDYLDMYMQVNVDGTRNVMTAARAAGADIFIATSSASVTIKPSTFLFPPWQKRPRHHVQISVNADPQPLDKLENFAGCYAYTKALAEKLVTDADDPEGGFRTGAIRPGHTIYGHGDENPQAVFFDYLRKGGLPT
jgi:nucleoside-diphosphate-sugar epimerase